MKINLKNSRLLCFLIAFFPVYALKYMLKSSLELHPIGNSILAVIAFVGIYFVLRSAVRCMDKRLAVISGIIGFFFSAFMILGTSILMFGTTQLNQPIVWFRILCGTPLFAALVSLILVYLSKWNQITQLQRLKVNLSVKKIFFLCWLLIFLAWIPGLIASYPGIYAYDSVFQMEYYESGVINLHHPLIHTYLLGFFVQTLGGLFGNLELGMLCYSLFQMLCLSAVFACVCVYLKK